MGRLQPPVWIKKRLVLWPLLHATTEPQQGLTDKSNGTVFWPRLHATIEPEQGLTDQKKWDSLVTTIARHH